MSAIYLLAPVPPWFRANLAQRLVKSSKIFLSDTGLLAHLNYIDDARLRHDDRAFWMLLENFVGTEVDFVLERGTRVVVIEVKATASPGLRDYAGLNALREAAGNDFLHGVLLYMGVRVLPIDDRISALPVGLCGGAGCQESLPKKCEVDLSVFRTAREASLAQPGSDRLA